MGRWWSGKRREGDLPSSKEQEQPSRGGSGGGGVNPATVKALSTFVDENHEDDSNPPQHGVSPDASADDIDLLTGFNVSKAPSPRLCASLPPSPSCLLHVLPCAFFSPSIAFRPLPSPAPRLPPSSTPLQRGPPPWGLSWQQLIERLMAVFGLSRVLQDSHDCGEISGSIGETADMVASEKRKGGGGSAQGPVTTTATGRAVFEVLRVDPKGRHRRLFVKRRDLLRAHQLQVRAPGALPLPPPLLHLTACGCNWQQQ